MVKTLIRNYGARIKELFEKGKTCGEIRADLDLDASATLFIGTIQGLVMPSLLTGDAGRLRRHAPSVFEIYKRGIQKTL